MGNWGLGKLEIKFSSGFHCGQAFIKINTSIEALVTFAHFTQGTHDTARSPESKRVGLAMPHIVHPITDTSRKARFGSLHVVVSIYKTGLDLSSGSRNFPAFTEKCTSTTIRSIKVVSQCSQKQIGDFILPGLSQEFISSSW